jgi:hypothetical protein
MTRIRVQATVGQPAAATERLLQEYMSGRRRGDGTISLPLRVRFHEGGGDDLSVVHDVVVHFTKSYHASGPNETFLVNWMPSGEGPYPSFSGVMNVYPEADARRSRIELDGAYEAPGGVIGRVFDAAIGSTIARSSLADLVERLAADLTPAASSTTRR